MGSRITRAARLRPCALRVPGCKNDRETVVLAHLPSNESGRGYKSPDWWGIFACAHCHDILDQRKKSPIPNWLLDEHVHKALFETQLYLFDQELLLISS